MDSDDEEVLLYLASAAAIQNYMDLFLCKEPCHVSLLTGHAYVQEVLTGHPVRCYDSFRMDKHVFRNLCYALRERKLLKDTRRVTVEEQLAIFLLTIGHNERNRIMQERFQHSGETISRHFNKVLLAFVKFAQEIIVPPSFAHTPIEIRGNPKHYPWFKDCIGAIDGSLVDAVVSTEKQIPYRDRKSNISQNLMAACGFDMRFTFVYAGWEGSANDSRILLEAIHKPHLNFPKAPEGKYYVVDAGYPNMPGFLAPYRGVRYHLPDYRRGSSPSGVKELFNHAHSSLRNVIERCFGVLKARFPILKRMPPYPFPTQRNIVVAACTVHNFIRQEALRDELFSQYEEEDLIIEEEHIDDEPDPDGVIQEQEIRRMDAFRQSIAEAISHSCNSEGP